MSTFDTRSSQQARSRRARIACTCALLLAVGATREAAALPDYAWYAGAAGSAPGSSWDEETSQYTWTNGGAVLTPGVSASPQLAAAYRFDGGDTMTGASFRSIIDSATTVLPMSFELWLRPTDLLGQEILFETGGGGDGISFTLDGSVLQFRAKDSGNDITLTHDLSAYMASGDFIQIVGTLELGVEANLFVNGARRVAGVDASGINSWSGGGATGIGSRNGNVGGHVGGDINGYSGFEGDVARVAFWRNQAIDDAEVGARWSSISAGVIPVPEPGSALLVGVGLALLGGARRR